MPLVSGKTVTQIFYERVQATPSLNGFYFKDSKSQWKPVRYQTFYERCEYLAIGLKSLGLQENEKVILLSHTRLEWSLSDMAILGNRSITVPIYPSSTEADIDFILTQTESSIAFLENKNDLETLLRIQARGSAQKIRTVILFDALKEKSEFPFQVLGLEEVLSIGQKEIQQNKDFFKKNLLGSSPNDLLTICYTSGTSGVPKGVMISHENMVSVLEDNLALFGHRIEPEQERILSFLPFSHIFGKMESLLGYVFGWKQYFCESLNQLTLNMQETHPTIIFSVPRIFEKAHVQIMEILMRNRSPLLKLLEHTPFQKLQGDSLFGKIQSFLSRKILFKDIFDQLGGSLKFAICGGAPLKKEVGIFFRSLGIPILEGYGLTETSASVTVNTFENWKIGSVGKPMPDVSIRISEEDEVFIKSRKVFKGYFKLPEETRAVFHNEWFKTGDLGFIDRDGFLHITGRKKDILVTSTGKNIAPQKIEKLIQSNRYIAHLVVVGDAKNYLCALVTLKQNETIRHASENHILFSEWEELVKNPQIISLIQKQIDEMNQKLASYERIQKFLILPNDFSPESGELTPSMKVKRTAINHKFQEEIDRMYQG